MPFSLIKPLPHPQPDTGIPSFGSWNAPPAQFLLESVPSAWGASLGFSVDSSLRCKYQFELCPLQPSHEKCLIRLLCFISSRTPNNCSNCHVHLAGFYTSFLHQCIPCQGGLCWGSEWHLPSILGKLIQIPITFSYNTSSQ